jgi:demethylmenaquinone methyltransferase/2-methoxy-6-polyprenyl-1,4-benzoquinol methylase
LWKRRLIRQANVRPGERALDVCCGTGDIALALAHAGANATGVDFSPAMLAFASGKRKLNGRNSRLPGCIPNRRGTVTLIRGDALRIPFADASFDLVTIGYGLRNLAGVKAGLTEMLRVLVPSGRLLVLDFGKPRNRFMQRFYFSYLRWVVPWFGRISCGDADAYGYILESLEHYPAQTGVADLMRELGCVDVRVVNLLGGMMGINYGEKPEV